MEVTLRGVWLRKVLRGGVRGVRAGVREKCAECSALWWFIEALQKHCFLEKCYAEVYAQLFSIQSNYIKYCKPVCHREGKATVWGETRQTLSVPDGTMPNFGWTL